MELLQQLHRLTGERFAVTPIEVSDIYHHYEDEELGFAPLYTQAKFSLPFTPATLWLVHEYGRRDRAPQLCLRMWPDEKQWHIIPSAKLCEQLRRLGIQRSVGWERKWELVQPIEPLVDAVLDTLACLSMMKVDFLRASDVPEGVAWPDLWLRDMILGAERITIIEQQPTFTRYAVVGASGSGRRDVSVRSSQTSFVEWWSSRMICADG